MEMHQVRYFLAVSRVLNFTRAAEECHVAQPSLTRAVKQLEDELGGELFRRERNFTHLTEFGQRMLPFLQQCFDSASAAKILASSMKAGAVAGLSLGVSRAVNLSILLPQLSELTRVFKGLEMRFLRGTREEVAEFLKKGEAELAIAGPLGQSWDRLDSWPLFTEGFQLAVSKEHRLAANQTVRPAEFTDERLLERTHCEVQDDFTNLMKEHNVTTGPKHKVVSDDDHIALIEANLGIGMLPKSTPNFGALKLIALEGWEFNRTIYLYSVAGRQRSAAGSALIKLLRAADWSPFAI